MLGASGGELEFIKRARIARFATADKSGAPSVVPICFVCDDGFLYTPIDAKPKSASALELRRVRNIIENPKVAVLVDRYDEDWARIGYALIRGDARMLHRGREYERVLGLLAGKYSQYEEMNLPSLGLPVIKITMAKITFWGKATLE
ncbi:MAG: TIGR03668 family PPOX class F420-dependent oxidoreductase [Deltaproteobacteria bacterium]